MACGAAEPAVYLTRRRGDAEKDAEKKEKSQRQRERGVSGERRDRSPSFARIDRLKPAPPRQFSERAGDTSGLRLGSSGFVAAAGASRTYRRAFSGRQ